MSLSLVDSLHHWGTASPQITPKTCVARPPITTVYLTCPFCRLFCSSSWAWFDLRASLKWNCQSALLYRDQLLRIRRADGHPHSCGLFCPRKSGLSSLSPSALSHWTIHSPLSTQNLQLFSWINLTPSMPTSNLDIFYFLLKYKLPFWSLSK